MTNPYDPVENPIAHDAWEANRDGAPFDTFIDDLADVAVTERVTVSPEDRMFPCGHTTAQHLTGQSGIATTILNLAADAYDLTPTEDGWPEPFLAAAAGWSLQDRDVLAQLTAGFLSSVAGAKEVAVEALVARGWHKGAAVVSLDAGGRTSNVVRRAVYHAMLVVMSPEEALSLLGLLSATAKALGIDREDLRAVQTQWCD